MAKRYRQTSKKREREMKRHQKKQDKAEKSAARKADRGGRDDAAEGPAVPGEDAGDPPAPASRPVGGWQGSVIPAQAGDGDPARVLVSKCRVPPSGAAGGLQLRHSGPAPG